MGPGPEIRLETSFNVFPAMLPEGWNCGEGREDEEPAWLTMLWFEGRIFSDGELGTGGGGICCDDARRAKIWGDGGTVLRSGMVIILSDMCSRRCREQGRPVETSFVGCSAGEVREE